MTNQTIIAAAAAAWRKAETGAIYTPRHGAPCPVCGQRMQVTRTFPWAGIIRLRYHACTNPDCLLAVLKKKVKSTEMENNK